MVLKRELVKEVVKKYTFLIINHGDGRKEGSRRWVEREREGREGRKGIYLSLKAYKTSQRFLKIMSKLVF